MYDRFKDKKVHYEYDFFSLCIPHYNKLQKIVADMILKYISSNFDKKDKIQLLDLWVWTWLWLQYVTSVLNNNNINYSIDAVDNNSKMLQLLKTKITLNKIVWNISLIESDAFTYLSERMNQYHFIYSWWMIHNFLQKDKSKIHKLIYQTLKEKWCFINVDKIALDSSRQQQKNLERQIQKFDLLTKYWKKDLRAERIEHYNEDEYDNRRMEEKSMIKKLRTIWFKNIEILHRHHLEAILQCNK